MPCEAGWLCLSTSGRNDSTRIHGYRFPPAPRRRPPPPHIPQKVRLGKISTHCENGGKVKKEVALPSKRKVRLSMSHQKTPQMKFCGHAHWKGLVPLFLLSRHSRWLSHGKPGRQNTVTVERYKPPPNKLPSSVPSHPQGTIDSGVRRKCTCRSRTLADLQRGQIRGGLDLAEHIFDLWTRLQLRISSFWKSHRSCRRGSLRLRLL